MTEGLTNLECGGPGGRYSTAVLAVKPCGYSSCLKTDWKERSKQRVSPEDVLNNEEKPRGLRRALSLPANPIVRVFPALRIWPARRNQQPFHQTNIAQFLNMKPPLNLEAVPVAPHLCLGLLTINFHLFPLERHFVFGQVRENGLPHALHDLGAIVQREPLGRDGIVESDAQQTRSDD